MTKVEISVAGKGLNCVSGNTGSYWGDSTVLKPLKPLHANCAITFTCRIVCPTSALRSGTRAPV